MELLSVRLKLGFRLIKFIEILAMKSLSWIQLADLFQAHIIQPAINNLLCELYQFLTRNVVRIEFPIEGVLSKIKAFFGKFSFA
jgi:hypothetical protein